MQLSNSQKKNFRKLKKILVFQYDNIETTMGVKPPSISEAIRLGKNKGIGTDSWEKVLTFIKRTIQSKRKELIQNATYNESLQLLESLLIDVTSKKEVKSAAGVLPHNTKNYIHRKGENNCVRQLLDGIHKCTLLQGGIQSGKSSFLKQFEKKATDKKYNVIYIDTLSLLLGVNTFTETDMFVELLNRVSSFFKTENQFSNVLFENTIISPMRTAKDVLNTWLKNNSITTRTYIIIDSIDNLYLRLKKECLPDSIINLLWWIHDAVETNKSGNKPYYENIHFIVSYSYITENISTASPIFLSSHNFTLGAFSDTEIKYLFNILHHETDLTEKEFQDFYTLFKGQPYLSHNAIWEMSYEKKEISNIENEAMNFDKKYQKHWNRMIKAISLIIEKKEKRDYFLKRIIDIAITEQKIDRIAYGGSNHADLFDIGLLTGDKFESSISRFYLQAIKATLSSESH